MASSPPINVNWFLHLQAQFERARPILFTGAGFSLGARNIIDEPIPSVPLLRSRLWELCFPGTPTEDGSSLQDLYEHALHRNRAKLAEMLTKAFTVQPETVPDWYGRVLKLPWQRCYTLNIDNLEEAASAKFDLPRRIVSISATNSSAGIRAAELGPGLEFVHLNGAISDVPDDVTFSVTQYAERLARPDPLYLRFAADLLTSPVILLAPGWMSLLCGST